MKKMNKQNIKEEEEVFELTPYMIQEIEKGEEAIKAGHVIAHEEVVKLVDEWLFTK